MPRLNTVDAPVRAPPPRKATEVTSIRPFRVRFSDEELADLRRRIKATRLPERETVTDFSQGLPLATVRKLAQCWATEYDWPKVEARLNAVPNFITVAGITSEACRARESATRLLRICAVGLAVCVSLPTLTHAQAVTITGDARVTHKESKPMPELNTVDAPVRAPAPRAASEDASVRPFRVRVSDEDLADLRQRIKATRWPEKEPVADFSQGVPLATMQKLARYWTTEYDWRKVEAKLNSYPQFITNIDGLDIHFIHVRSKEKNALPVIITHGWPGSIIEQLKIVDPLVDPTAYGGSASDAFDVVIPSMPGYGYSGKPTTTGWDHVRIARAWAVLMKRLGYTRYVAQGGDWGAIINDQFALQGYPELIGMHTNLPVAIPADINKAAAAGGPAPTGLSAEEKRAYETVVLLYKTIPTQFFMAAHPQTLYGIADSPIGVAAWLLDHDPISLRLIVRAFDGEATGLTRDDVLDNVTLFWLTNTTISAARLYREGFAKVDFGPKNVSIPVAVSVFPDEQYHTPRSWAERAYPKLIHYNQLPKGGHFAAWEQPKLLVDEMRVGLRSLR